MQDGAGEPVGGHRVRRSLRAGTPRVERLEGPLLPALAVQRLGEPRGDRHGGVRGPGPFRRAERLPQDPGGGLVPGHPVEQDTVAEADPGGR
ncbi:hypothetical protein ACPB9E_11500 [Streptomyces exfoliatus]|uniref:hypothetical protein n=1 Tax=Streptomyces exfoliatus TaxID=1905 RepID=UPI003C2B3B6D